MRIIHKHFLEKLARQSLHHRILSNCTSSSRCKNTHSVSLNLTFSCRTCLFPNGQLPHSYFTFKNWNLPISSGAEESQREARIVAALTPGKARGTGVVRRAGPPWCVRQPPRSLHGVHSDFQESNMEVEDASWTTDFSPLPAFVSEAQRYKFPNGCSFVSNSTMGLSFPQ